MDLQIILSQIRAEFKLSSQQEARELLADALTAQCVINNVLDQVEFNLTGAVEEARNHC